MEKLSNSYQELYNTVKEELLTLVFDDTSNLIVSYAEFPWFPGGQFSVSAILDSVSDSITVVKQYWDSNYDIERFSHGVFNLSRICIKRESFDLSVSGKERLIGIINSITTLPVTLENTECFVLDGVDYHLSLKTSQIDKVYKWKIPTPDIAQFQQLIDLLKNYESNRTV